MKKSAFDYTWDDIRDMKKAYRAGLIGRRIKMLESIDCWFSFEPYCKEGDIALIAFYDEGDNDFYVYHEDATDGEGFWADEYQFNLLPEIILMEDTPKQLSLF